MGSLSSKLQKTLLVCLVLGWSSMPLSDYGSTVKLSKISFFFFCFSIENLQLSLRRLHSWGLNNFQGGSYCAFSKGTSVWLEFARPNS